MAKKTQLVFSTTDYFGNLVTLAQGTWVEHILDPQQGHPEMEGLEDIVEDVIKNPNEIRISSGETTALLYISSPGVGPRPEGVRAVVKYETTLYEKGATRGAVATAYPIDIKKYGTGGLGKRIYQR